jgi:hypothetical protein
MGRISPKAATQIRRILAAEMPQPAGELMPVQPTKDEKRVVVRHVDVEDAIIDRGPAMLGYAKAKEVRSGRPVAVAVAKVVAVGGVLLTAGYGVVYVSMEVYAWVLANKPMVLATCGVALCLAIGAAWMAGPRQQRSRQVTQSEGAGDFEVEVTVNVKIKKQ